MLNYPRNCQLSTS